MTRNQTRNDMFFGFLVFFNVNIENLNFKFKISPSKNKVDKIRR